METRVINKVKCGLSTAKANRLFWLGRYAERVYITLHLLRKHFDLMIDEDESSYMEFCRLMGIENKYASAEDFVQRYLFDGGNPESVINMLNRVMDNAILLRDEIYTETLSYVELSIAYMNHADTQATGFPAMQQVTDYMLAFWGSVDERLTNDQIRHTMKFGKYLESMELRMRFEYPYYRIEEIFKRMLHCIEKECFICDEITLLTLKEQLTPEKYPSKGLIYLVNSLPNV